MKKCCKLKRFYTNYSWKSFYWEWDPWPAFGSKPQNKFLASYSLRLLLFYTKNMTKAYFNQPLASTACTCWSKYTTHDLDLASPLKICNIFWLLKATHKPTFTSTFPQTKDLTFYNYKLCFSMFNNYLVL